MKTLTQVNSNSLNPNYEGISFQPFLSKSSDRKSEEISFQMNQNNQMEEVKEYQYFSNSIPEIVNNPSTEMLDR